MQLPGLSVGIVADDLTGACDTALQFFSTHAKSHILLGFQRVDVEPPSQEQFQENHVWSVNTASRHENPYQAQAAVRQAIALCRDRFGVENFYKKIDSTLRGNIAHECLGMLDELKAQCAVIVPAYPQEGRRTVGGYQLLRGVPVEKTIVARDPLCPVRQSHVPTLLKNQIKEGKLVGHIQLSDVLHGAGPILVKLNELIKEEKKLVVIDAATQEDLEQIALAIEKAQQNARVLPCGSAGLAHALSALWANEPEGPSSSYARIPETIVREPSPILVINGSNTDTTRQQILKLIEHHPLNAPGSNLEIFELSSDLILGLSPAEEVIERVQKALTGRNMVILTTSLNEETYFRTLSLAQEHDISDYQASQNAEAILARITAEAVQNQSVKMVISGGETTCTIGNRLGIQELEIIAKVEDSVPLTIDQKGRWIITKSGGFGTPMTLVNVLKFIKQREVASIHA